MSLSREDGKLEGKAEVDSARAIARDLEAQLRAQVNEFKKHREDHASIAGRLASALQTAQVAMAECEAAKAQANGAISEGQTSHSALIQATHRMQQLDQECVALKTEYLMLRTENDTQAGEIRKLMNVSGINGDKLAETYADFKRLKANSQVSHTIFYSLSLSLSLTIVNLISSSVAVMRCVPISHTSSVALFSECVMSMYLEETATTHCISISSSLSLFLCPYH